MNTYWITFLQSSGLELPIYIWASRKILPLSRSISSFFVMNGVTHPLVFFGIMALPFSYRTTILSAEAFAIVSETFLFFWITQGQCNWVRSFTISTTANLASWQFAPILTALRNGWL